MCVFFVQKSMKSYIIVVIKYLYKKGERIGGVFQGEGISCENVGKS